MPSPAIVLVAAIDLRGRYREPFSNWEAATDAPPARLRGDLELLPAIAEAGSPAPPRISARAASSAPRRCWRNAPASPSTSTSLQSPKPAACALERWLQTFPSFGYLLSVEPANAAEIIARLSPRAASRPPTIGAVAHGSRVTVGAENISETIWDFAHEPLIGAGTQRKRFRWRRSHDDSLRPLRIAMLAHSTNPRGGVVHAIELADSLTRLGHERRFTRLMPAARDSSARRSRRR